MLRTVILSVDAQIGQRTLDAPIPPGGVLLGHLDGEPLDLLGHGWPPQLCAAHTPVKLLGDQSFVPAQEGVGSDKGRYLFKALAAEWVGQRSKPSALGLGEAEPSVAELGFEHAVFRKEIRDDLLLMPLQPAGNHGDQNMEDHSRS